MPIGTSAHLQAKIGCLIYDLAATQVGLLPDRGVQSLSLEANALRFDANPLEAFTGTTIFPFELRNGAIVIFITVLMRSGKVIGHKPRPSARGARTEAARDFVPACNHT